jgi:iron complex outermembrane receptor protein
MKKLLFVLFFIGFAQTYAQSTLSGTITDTDNQALYGVEIYAPQLHKGTTSNEAGTYELKNIPNGKITINFTYIGYKTISKTFNFSNGNIQFDAKMDASVFEIDEVIVSTPFNKLQSENVMKVDRLSARAIQKVGAPTLAEGITVIPGVSQVSTGVSIGKPVIRGLSGNRVLVYTQGVRLENQQFGGEHGLGINGAGIEGVEVIKGPASLLYGSDALGGVLYIQPERFAAEGQTKVAVQQQFFTNTQGSNTSLGLKSSLENWQFLARGTYAIHSDYKIPTGQLVTNTRFKEKDLKLGVGFHQKNFTSEVRYNYNDSDLGLTEGFGEQSRETHLENPYQNIQNHILSMHNHIFFGDSKLDLDLGYIVNNRKEFEEHEEHGHGGGAAPDPDHDEHEEGEAALNMKLKTFNFNAKYHLPKFGAVEMIVGVQGMHQNNKNFGEEILIPNAKVNDIGVFTTANYTFDENTALQAGLRFDNRNITTERHEIKHEAEVHVFEALDKSFNSFTASLGFKTVLFDMFTTRINIAKGFRAPNLAELASNGVHHGTNRFEEGNANLKNEQNYQFDLALEYGSEHFEVFANAFYNNINDYIFLSPTGEVEDGAPVYTYLQEDANLFGGEIGFHLHPHPLDWLHLESSFESVIGKRDSKRYLPLIPTNVFKNTLRGEFQVNNWLKNSFASFGVQSFMDQNRVSEFETPTPGYTIANLSIGSDIYIGKYKFTGSINVRNLFDKKYINHLSRLKSDNILNPGRNIVFNLQFGI